MIFATPPRTTLFPPLGLVTRTNGVAGTTEPPPGGIEGIPGTTGLVAGGIIGSSGGGAESLRE